MFPTLSLILAAVAFFNSLQPATADNARVFRCPCTFSVARKTDQSRYTNDEAFDILVENLELPRANLREEETEIIEKHSSRNVRLQNGTHSDSTFVYFRRMNITDTGLFRVTIRHHGMNGELLSPDAYNLQLHRSARQLICPVVLAPHMPSERIGNTSPESISNLTTRQHRIQGGLFAAPGLVPYLVSIDIPLSSDSRSSCTGTLLSAKWVMTAAHCRIRPGFKVYISTRKRVSGFFVQVKRWIPHPGFRFNFSGVRDQSDIAVIELDRRVRRCCVPRPRFMEVSLNAIPPKAGVFTRAAGYGIIRENPSVVRDPNDGALRSVDVPIVSNDVCSSQYLAIAIVSRTFQVCAGYFKDGGCDTCGDSGGPLLQYDGNKPVIIGVTSFGLGCGNRGFPGVYTRPSGHMEWLKSTGAVFKEHTGTIDEVVQNCEPGQHLPYTPGEISTCTECPARRVSDGGPVRECKRCRPTLFRDTDDGARCSCRARAGFGLRRGRCVPCRPGFASPLGENSCKRCRAGTFSNSSGRASCKRCPGARRGARRCPSRRASA